MSEVPKVREGRGRERGGRGTGFRHQCLRRDVTSAPVVSRVFAYSLFILAPISLLQMKLITIAAMSERLKIGGSLARAAVREMVQKGVVRAVSYHAKIPVYTRASE